MNDPSDYTEPDSPFESSPGAAGEPHGGPEPEPEPEPGGKSFDYWGLRNSSPPVRPADVGRDLDLDADWYEHLFTGFLKQSGAEAAEAWQHYVISMLLLADQEYGILDDTDKEDLEDAAGDDWDIE